MRNQTERKTGKRKFTLRGLGMYTILVAWSLTTIIPLAWVLLNSFKSSKEILINSIALPSEFRFTNYATLLSYEDINMARAFLNSLIISGGTLIGVLVLAGMASFALGRFHFKAAPYIMSVLVACLLVPSFAVLIPNFVMISKLPIQGTYLAPIFPQIAGNICFAIIMLTGFMRSLPRELDEAAVTDGAGVLRIFWHITIPLTLPMLSTVGIMVFIWSYNDLLTPLIYLSSRSLQPISVILTLVSNLYGTDYGAMMAAIMITIVPVLVLYVFSQEQVIKGMTAGAVKG